MKNKHWIILFGVSEIVAGLLIGFSDGFNFISGLLVGIGSSFIIFYDKLGLYLEGGK